jgi:hypothetical protein
MLLPDLFSCAALPLLSPLLLFLSGSSRSRPDLPVGATLICPALGSDLCGRTCVRSFPALGCFYISAFANAVTLPAIVDGVPVPEHLLATFSLAFFASDFLADSPVSLLAWLY